MTGKSDFPPEIQTLIDEITDDGFDIAYGEVTPLGTPGFLAESGETLVQVADHGQVWMVTAEIKEGRIDDSWDCPSRVASGVRDLLDAAS